MDLDKFSRIAESLRQYRRAELKDFESDLGAKPLDELYVDALHGDAVLKSVISSNTTFLLGRKGTGKSTVFAKAQSLFRSKREIISIYVDVKTVCDILDSDVANAISYEEYGISKTAYKAHLLRKSMLGSIVSELLKEIGENCDTLSLWDRWKGIRKQYDELKKSLNTLRSRVSNTELESHEIPILQKITRQIKIKKQEEQSSNLGGKLQLGGSGGKNDISLSLESSGSYSDFDKTLDDSEIYNEYSDVVLKSFPFSEIIEEIQTLNKEAGLIRTVVFFDDFSELNFVDQRLFVDVILAPLNNSSNEAVKLKVAGYPGRVYYGKIDPSKTDTISLDFSDLYESNEVQEMERSAAHYAERLLDTRFKAFGCSLADYFDMPSESSKDEVMKLMFRASFNVPRIMGHLLHTLFLDRVSKGLKITQASIRLASRKYYESTIDKYFDRLNRYALEPFENKLDRHNQQELLRCLINEAKDVRKKIISGEVG
ncbi:transcriptional regulator, partial [Vibrio cyclitrophicus]